MEQQEESNNEQDNNYMEQDDDDEHLDDDNNNNTFEQSADNEADDEPVALDDDDNNNFEEAEEGEAVDDNRLMDQAEMEQLIKNYHLKKKNPLEHQQQASAEEESQEFNTIHSTNAQNLIEQITRNKIFNSIFYKEECFGLNAATVIDKAELLDSIGGTFGGLRKPSNFLCLLMKMLQIEVDLESTITYIHNGEFKYLTALGALYLRLVGSATDVYEQLEPLYSDYRKLRLRLIDGTCKILHMDEYIEMLLSSDSFCDVKLPFLIGRRVLERNGKLNPYVSALETNEEYKAIIIKKMSSSGSEEAQPTIATTATINTTTNTTAAAKKSSGGGFKLNLKKKNSSSSSVNQQQPELINSSEKQDSSESLSIEETNKLRISLGLAPLKQ